MQFLMILRGAHLVLNSQRKYVGVIGFDMHLLVECLDVVGIVTGGVKKKGGKVGT